MHSLLCCGKNCRENRYLLFLTENYAALQTLQHFLEVNYHNMEKSDGSSAPHSLESDVDKQPPLILFGSSFPKDKHFTQVTNPGNHHAVIIILFIFEFRFTETSTQSKSAWRPVGQSFCLTWMIFMKASMMHSTRSGVYNAEVSNNSLQQLLIDFTFLQYYLVYGGTRLVDLGLQTHRIKCRVHDNFKLVKVIIQNHC